MKITVNLLSPEEARYQGPVSLRFALYAGGSTVALVLLILIGVSIQRQVSTRRALSAAREEWQRVEPKFNEVQKKQKRLRDSQALVAELGLWNTTRVDWHAIMRELQAGVPPSVQLNRLNIGGTWNFVSPDGGPQGPAKEPPVPTRAYSLNIYGSAAGELADETVVQLTRAMRDKDTFRKVFEVVRLQRMTRESSGEKESPDRLFEIEGTSVPFKLK